MSCIALPESLGKRICIKHSPPTQKSCRETYQREYGRSHKHTHTKHFKVFIFPFQVPIFVIFRFGCPSSERDSARCFLLFVFCEDE